MAFQMDFTRDVAAHCVEKLIEAGYTPNLADDEDAIYTYVDNWPSLLGCWLCNPGT